jgi:hypothetical protein
MLEIVRQIIDFYYKNEDTPKLEDLDIKDKTLLEKK